MRGMKTRPGALQRTSTLRNSTRDLRQNRVDVVGRVMLRRKPHIEQVFKSGGTLKVAVKPAKSFDTSPQFIAQSLMNSVRT